MRAHSHHSQDAARTAVGQGSATQDSPLPRSPVALQPVVVRSLSGSLNLGGRHIEVVPLERI